MVITDADVVLFAGRMYRQESVRTAAIRSTFGIRPANFRRMLNSILDNASRIAALPPDLWPIVDRLDSQRLGRLTYRDAF
jgi:hypothetical protein